ECHGARQQGAREGQVIVGGDEVLRQSPLGDHEPAFGAKIRLNGDGGGVPAPFGRRDGKLRRLRAFSKLIVASGGVRHGRLAGPGSNSPLESTASRRTFEGQGQAWLTSGSFGATADVGYDSDRDAFLSRSDRNSHP